jgi:lipopolysaccharide/colanic/teichoic acid biosynthesis glycosyltransferase
MEDGRKGQENRNQGKGLLDMAAIDHEATSARSFKIWTGEFGKRLFDVIVSTTGLIILSPVFAVIALYIKRTCPGPVFYRGNRVGRQGKNFNILKFSTMIDCPDAVDGPRITAKNDPRITPVGRWLRDTKLNEIPQLWNVLKGEMSLVGPRPEDPAIAATWTEDERQSILSIRPGITSPASISFRDEEMLLETDTVVEKYLSNIVPSKLRLDQIYAKDHNFLGDLDIIFLTMIALLPGVRNRSIPENLLTWGPLERIFTRHVNLFLIDVPTAFVAVGISGLIWRSAGPFNLGWGPAALLALVIALLFGLVNAALGMNRISWSSARALDALGLAVSDAFTMLILFFIDRLGVLSSFRDLNLPIGLWITISLLAFLGFVVVRYRTRLMTGLATRWLQWRGATTRLGERVLIVGAGEMAQLAAGFFRQGEPGKVLNIIGMVDDNSKKIGLQFDGDKVIGSTEDIPNLVKRWNIGVILFAIGNIPLEKRNSILKRCRQTKARIVLVPDLLEMLSGCLFAPDQLTGQVVPADWDGAVPIPEVVKWLTELEGLALPENVPLLARLRQVRNALAAHVVNDHGPKQN